MKGGVEMDYNDLIPILERGEDSYHQFKVRLESIDNLAVEISAFANSDGGHLIIGVGNTGDIIGLSKTEVDAINQWISNATSQKIEPPVFVKTEIIDCAGKRVLMITIPRGLNKPYAVNKTEFWVKNGADKRRATREELFRLLQASNTLFADEMETEAMLEEFDVDYYKQYYNETKKGYEKELDKLGIPLVSLLENIKLLKNSRLTLAGLMLFGKNPESIKPQFGIKGTFYDGTSIAVNRYKDSIRASGKLIDQFKETLHFIRRNLRMIQSGPDFNSPSVLEIPEVAFAEAVANAIAHRDYFINSQIFVNLFDDRLEIVSPGILPNTLTAENLKYGVHIERNPIILFHLEKLADFRYSGKGSGIPRIIELCNARQIKVLFMNDVDNTQFKVVFYRPTL
jgi:predicted HTH transcriptional regulator